MHQRTPRSATKNLSAALCASEHSVQERRNPSVREREKNKERKRERERARAQRGGQGSKPVYTQNLSTFRGSQPEVGERDAEGLCAEEGAGVRPPPEMPERPRQRPQERRLQSQKLTI